MYTLSKWQATCPHCQKLLALPLQPSPIGTWECPHCKGVVACYPHSETKTHITLTVGVPTAELLNSVLHTKFRHGQAAKGE
jgi:phage FluMu protein Com